MTRFKRSKPGRHHFYVIEGAGKVYGMAGAGKVQAAVLYSLAGKNK